MSNLFEICFYCISKEKLLGEVNEKYKNMLNETFQCVPSPIHFSIKTLVIKNKENNTINSTIKLYRKLPPSPQEKTEKNQTSSSNQKNKVEQVEKSPEEKIKEEKIKVEKLKEEKINMNMMNKDKIFSKITFLGSIKKFLETSKSTKPYTLFMKYISNKKIESPIGETKVIEIARCGYNMEEILKELGYEEDTTRNEENEGFLYQYKYYPIICIYNKIKDEKGVDKEIENYRFLQIKGYYNEESKDKIVSKMKELSNILRKYFIIK
jgi:hypothetical protein